MSPTRAEILRDLVELTRLPSELQDQVRALTWDSPEELVTLTAKDVRHVLEAYVSGKLGDAELAQWADLIEVREDIGLQQECEDLLKEFVFEAANPAINGQFDRQRAETWLQKIREHVR